MLGNHCAGGLWRSGQQQVCGYRFSDDRCAHHHAVALMRRMLAGLAGAQVINRTPGVGTKDGVFARGLAHAAGKRKPKLGQHRKKRDVGYEAG